MQSDPSSVDMPTEEALDKARVVRCDGFYKLSYRATRGRDDETGKQSWREVVGESDKSLKALLENEKKIDDRAVRDSQEAMIRFDEDSKDQPVSLGVFHYNEKPCYKACVEFFIQNMRKSNAIRCNGLYGDCFETQYIDCNTTERGEKTFKMNPRDQYALYTKQGYEQMACVKPAERFLREASLKLNRMSSGTGAPIDAIRYEDKPSEQGDPDCTGVMPRKTFEAMDTLAFIHNPALVTLEFNYAFPEKLEVNGNKVTVVVASRPKPNVSSPVCYCCAYDESCTTSISYAIHYLQRWGRKTEHQVVVALKSQGSLSPATRLENDSLKKFALKLNVKVLEINVGKRPAGIMRRLLAADCYRTLRDFKFDSCSRNAAAFELPSLLQGRADQSALSPRDSASSDHCEGTHCNLEEKAITLVDLTVSQ